MWWYIIFYRFLDVPDKAKKGLFSHRITNQCAISLRPRNSLRKAGRALKDRSRRGLVDSHLTEAPEDWEILGDLEVTLLKITSNSRCTIFYSPRFIILRVLLLPRKGEFRWFWPKKMTMAFKMLRFDIVSMVISGSNRWSYELVPYKAI